jgi:hypothetical protein
MRLKVTNLIKMINHLKENKVLVFFILFLISYIWTDENHYAI